MVTGTKGSIQREPPELPLRSYRQKLTKNFTITNSSSLCANIIGIEIENNPWAVKSLVKTLYEFCSFCAKNVTSREKIELFSHLCNECTSKGEFIHFIKVHMP